MHMASSWSPRPSTPPPTSAPLPGHQPGPSAKPQLSTPTIAPELDETSQRAFATAPRDGDVADAAHESEPSTAARESRTHDEVTLRRMRRSGEQPHLDCVSVLSRTAINVAGW